MHCERYAGSKKAVVKASTRYSAVGKRTYPVWTHRGGWGVRNHTALNQYNSEIEPEEPSHRDTKRPLFCASVRSVTPLVGSSETMKKRMQLCSPAKPFCS